MEKGGGWEKGVAEMMATTSRLISFRWRRRFFHLKIARGIKKGI